MSTVAVKSVAPVADRLHPLALRIMHWINAVAIFIMIGSGWKIYNDDVILGWLHFPDAVVIGKWAQYGLQWHFFGMWIFVINGLCYLTYGLVTGRFRHKLFPISVGEIVATVGEALRFQLKHDDLTRYNAVQKMLYLGIMAIGILIVLSGLALWLDEWGYPVVDGRPLPPELVGAAKRAARDCPRRAITLQVRETGH
jgi:thiosulfate reductase cytochrome b subunit